MDMPLVDSEWIEHFVGERVTATRLVNIHESTVWWGTIGSCRKNHKTTSLKPHNTFPEKGENLITVVANWAYGNWSLVNKPCTMKTSIVLLNWGPCVSSDRERSKLVRRLFTSPRSPEHRNTYRKPAPLEYAFHPLQQLQLSGTLGGWTYQLYSDQLLVDFIRKPDCCACVMGIIS